MYVILCLKDKPLICRREAKRKEAEDSGVLSVMSKVMRMTYTMAMACPPSLHRFPSSNPLRSTDGIRHFSAIQRHNSNCYVRRPPMMGVAGKSRGFSVTCAVSVEDSAFSSSSASENASPIKKRVVSGVQPTGSIHLGNYLGAIKNWVSLQDKFETLFFIVDLHAITLPYEAEQLSNTTRDTAALYIACGINPSKAYIFVQSHVPAHAELAWLLNCVTPIGWLNKMIQFKEKSRKAVISSMEVFHVNMLLNDYSCTKKPFFG